MATTGPSCFNFLKEGLLLPARNRKLFTQLCAVVVAASSLLLLANDLAIQPLAAEIRLDVKALNGTDPGSPDYARLVKEIREDANELLLVGAGYVLFALVVGSAVRIVLLFAAVFTYSGEQGTTTTTFGALLGKTKAQLKGPLLTLAFVYVLEIVYAMLMVFMGALLVLLIVKQYLVLLLLTSLLFLAAAVCYLYFTFICSVSLVVAVAEPGCHGAAAFGQAWRLAKGNKMQVLLFIAVTGALAAVLSPVHTLATACQAGNSSVPLGLLIDFLYALLMALLQLFAVCAMTAFYYERKENSNTQLMATTGYAKVSSTEEAIA